MATFSASGVVVGVVGTDHVTLRCGCAAEGVTLDVALSNGRWCVAKIDTAAGTNPPPPVTSTTVITSAAIGDCLVDVNGSSTALPWVPTDVFIVNSVVSVTFLSQAYLEPAAAFVVRARVLARASRLWQVTRRRGRVAAAGAPRAPAATLRRPRAGARLLGARGCAHVRVVRGRGAHHPYRPAPRRQQQQQPRRQRPRRARLRAPHAAARV